MVKLEFKTELQTSLSEAWTYFSDFENIVEWDPNTTYCKLISLSQGEVGAQYLLKSIFNRKESELVYTVTIAHSTPQLCILQLIGRNDNVESLDEITLTTINDNKTLLEYRADICLQGIKCLFTPFIVNALKKIRDDCKEGVEERSKLKWGQTA